MRRFFIKNQHENGDSVHIDGSDAKHILTVLRCSPGDIIGFFDSYGFEYESEIVSVDKGNFTARILSKKISEKESHLRLALAQSFLKDKKMDTLVRHLTELGMTDFAPFYSERSVPSPDRKRIAKRIERWKKIALESVKQCERGKIPLINAPVSFEDLLSFSAQFELKIIFCERKSGERMSNLKMPQSVIVLIGPEGGFSDKEIQRAEDAGFIKSSLGPRILKAETASVAAASIVQYTFGDLS